MKKIFLGLLLAGTLVVPLPATAEVNISFGFSLPPPIVFEAPPEVIIMPDTRGVYVVPDIEEDIFFWNGWWWRSWEGRWYRSHYYSRGWAYYNRVPNFYYDLDPGWRSYYHDRNWNGHRWEHQRIPHSQLQKNWKRWDNNRHWEKRGTWGVQQYQPRPHQQRQELRTQRQQQYHQRPEVQQHQQQIQERQNRQKQQAVQQQQHQQQQQREVQQQQQQRQQHQQQQRQHPQVQQPPHQQRQQQQHKQQQPRGESHKQQGKPDDDRDRRH